MSYPHSDFGNARLLADIFGDYLRYRPDDQTWLHWDGGHHWKILDRDEELRFAAYTAKKRFEGLAEMDLEAQKKESQWALQSQNLPRMQAMLTYARSQTPIKSLEEPWDSHPMLLAAPNGVINLIDGSLRPGHKQDYITQSIDIEYDPDARCPRFLQFLHEVFDGDQEKIAYLQRAVGYSITGSTREQVFFLLYGTGSNGKSKIRNVLAALLGNYAQSARFSAFEENPISDHQRDLAELINTRAVFASEGSERKKLDTSVLKYITGEEPIRTSRKYGHPFTFQPQFKIWLSANYLPLVEDNSYGFWRRIVVIPFEKEFRGANRDPYLEDKLMAELPGVLNWAVAGAQLWFKEGLKTPDSLLLQVSKYRDSRDSISKFLNEECITGDGHYIMSNELYSAYVSWCEGEGTNPVTGAAFGRRINSLYERKRTKMGMVYEGLQLSPEGG